MAVIKTIFLNLVADVQMRLRNTRDAGLFGEADVTRAWNLFDKFPKLPSVQIWKCGKGGGPICMYIVRDFSQAYVYYCMNEADYQCRSFAELQCADYWDPSLPYSYVVDEMGKTPREFSPMMSDTPPDTHLGKVYPKPKKNIGKSLPDFASDSRR